MLSGALAFSGAESNLYKLIRSYVDDLRRTGTIIDSSIADFRDNMATWFDNTMKRSNGWYRRHAKKASFVIGMILAIAFNIDAVNITSTLWTQPTLRKAIVTQLA